MNVIDVRPATEPAPKNTWIPYQAGKEFYPRLEALRGLAALAVAAFHSFQSQWLDSEGRLRRFNVPIEITDQTSDWTASFLKTIGNGHGAVILFFVISGFVLAGSLSRSSRQAPVKQTWDFFVARVFRILPAAFGTIFVFAVLFFSTGASLSGGYAYDALGLIRNALLIETSINGVMWTLPIEMLAVPLILLVFFGYRRWGPIVCTSAFVVLAALSFHSTWNRAWGLWDLGIIYAFIPGMAAFFLGQRLVARCSPRITPTLFMLSVAAFMASRPVIGQYSRWAVLAEALSGTIIVALLAFGHIGTAGRFFELAVVRFFGRISYSFYLLHPLTLIVLWKMPELLGAAVQSGVPKLVVAPALLILSTAAIAPLAWAMFQYVERPGVAMGRRVMTAIR